MKILAFLLVLFALDVSFGSAVEEKDLFSFSMRDLYMCVLFFLGSIISFGLGGAHEWHLTIQDIRIDEGKITGAQRHQLLAGFKDRAVLWSGIIGLFIAIMTTQVEHLSEKLSFSAIMSGLLILMGPYLLGRLVYIYYLHGAEYRKKKTTASRNYLPFYFMNISALILIVCFWSLSEFVYLLVGGAGQNEAFIYMSLTVKLLVSLIVPALIDQVVIVINIFKKIDKRPRQFAILDNGLARMLGYWEQVEAQIAIDKAHDEVKIEKNGAISMEDADMSILLQTDRRALLDD